MIFGKQVRFCPNCGFRLYDGNLTDTHVKSMMCSTKCREDWELKYARSILGKDSAPQFPFPFDPERPLGPDWTHEHAMMVHSAIACALEELGWHPCPAIKAAWTALAAITTEYKLSELPNEEEP